MQPKAKEPGSGIEELSLEIDKYPKEGSLSDPNTLIEIGDNHANIMTLIQILVTTGVIKLKGGNDTYKKMYDAYMYLQNIPEKKSEEKKNRKCKENLEILRESIANDVIVKKGIEDLNLTIQSDGDKKADRGAWGNELFDLLLEDKLRKAGIKLISTFSDHDMYWFYNNEKLKNLSTEDQIKYLKSENKVMLSSPETQQQSAYGTYKLINEGLIGWDEISQLTDESAKEVNIISYNLSENGEKIDISMHAPNNFGAISDLAEAFLDKPIRRDVTAIELAHIIDQINNKFQNPDESFKEILGRSLKYTIESKSKEYGELLEDESKLKEFKTSNKKITANHEAAESEKLEARANLLAISLFQFAWKRLVKGSSKTDWGEINTGTYPDSVGKIIHGHTSVGRNADERQIGFDNSYGKWLTRDALPYGVGEPRFEVDEARLKIVVAPRHTLEEVLERIVSNAKKSLDGIDISDKNETVTAFIQETKNLLGEIESKYKNKEDVDQSNIEAFFKTAIKMKNFIKDGNSKQIWEQAW